MDSLPFVTRLWFAWACFFRVLFDGAFALRAWKARTPSEPTPKELPKPVEIPKATVDSALQLLALLQREGRLVDFLQEDLAGADDRDVGAAVRIVHQGCAKALRDHGTFESIRDEQEGARVTLNEVPKNEVVLVGNVPSAPPFAGTLRHRGWRLRNLSLPVTVGAHDPTVIAPAEIEL